MAREIKTGGAKIETVVTAAFRKRYDRHCKKANVSRAQRIRDLMQADIKGTILLPDA